MTIDDSVAKQGICLSDVSLSVSKYLWVQFNLVLSLTGLYYFVSGFEPQTTAK